MQGLLGKPGTQSEDRIEDKAAEKEGLATKQVCEAAEAEEKGATGEPKRFSSLATPVCEENMKGELGGMAHEEEPASQVSSAVVMPRSVCTCAVRTVTLPVRSDDMAMAMVATATKRISCTVDEKTAGRPPSLGGSRSAVVEDGFFSGALDMLDSISPMFAIGSDGTKGEEDRRRSSLRIADEGRGN